MYPFIIYFEKNVFACLNIYTQQGYERTIMIFWYPSIHLSWLPKDINFVTDEPSYPDITAPWNRSQNTNEDWDVIPF